MLVHSPMGNQGADQGIIFNQHDVRHDVVALHVPTPLLPIRLQPSGWRYNLPVTSFTKSWPFTAMITVSKKTMPAICAYSNTFGLAGLRATAS